MLSGKWQRIVREAYRAGSPSREPCCVIPAVQGEGCPPPLSHRYKLYQKLEYKLYQKLVYKLYQQLEWFWKQHVPTQRQKWIQVRQFWRVNSYFGGKKWKGNILNRKWNFHLSNPLFEELQYELCIESIGSQELFSLQKIDQNGSRQIDFFGALLKGGPEPLEKENHDIFRFESWGSIFQPFFWLGTKNESGSFFVSSSGW